MQNSDNGPKVQNCSQADTGQNIHPSGPSLTTDKMGMMTIPASKVVERITELLHKANP